MTISVLFSLFPVNGSGLQVLVPLSLSGNIHFLFSISSYGSMSAALRLLHAGPMSLDRSSQRNMAELIQASHHYGNVTNDSRSHSYRPIVIYLDNKTARGQSVTLSYISWRSVLLVEETGGLTENHRPIASH